MSHTSQPSKSSIDSEMNRPTTFGIMHDIMYDAKGNLRPIKERSTFEFMYYIYGEDIHKVGHIGNGLLRPPHFSNPVAAVMRRECDLPNVLDMPLRMTGTIRFKHNISTWKGPRKNSYYRDDVPLHDPINDLKVLANFRRRSQGQEIKLTPEEAGAIIRLILPLVPAFPNKSHAEFLMFTDFRKDGRFVRDPNTLLNPRSSYMPEVLARMMQPDGMLDYTKEHDRKLVEEVDGLMCNIGNAFVLIDSGFRKWRSPYELSEQIIHNDTKFLSFFIDNRYYSFLGNALGQMAIDAGIDRPDFTVKGFEQFMQNKLGIVHLMRTLGSMKGKMEGYKHFEAFELARADYDTALQLINRFKRLPADKLGPDGENLLKFLNDEDLPKFMEAYKARFRLAPDASNSVVNTNPELDYLLCRAPESGRFADYMNKQTAAGR